MNELQEGFKLTWGDMPYAFQERVAEKLLARRSAILQAPTGSGKTMAALYPFVHAYRNGVDFPAKCIYAVPMRVLANQFVEEFQQRIKNLRVTVQTGERPEDRVFRSNLVFATIDQVLSSFLHMPYSLSRRQANLNAGAVAASYLVFDEFHLFDPESTLPTTLEMLRTLRGVAPFLLMTATFSSKMLDGLAKWLDADVIPGNDAELAEMLNLPVEQSKHRVFHWVNDALTADAILQRHSRRSLVVCNQVERAQCLYRALRDHPQRGHTEVILLHSRFLTDDRAALEQQLRTLFGKNANRQEGSFIAVATQVIEVGLDISAEVLHSELAPANAILQRAGRCARFKNESGTVYVYPVENVLPYRGQERVIALTAEWLQKHNGQRIHFLEEQEWIDYAHGEHDQMMFQGVKATNSSHRQRIEAALNGDLGQAGELIRRIASQPVTVSANPELLLPQPFDAPLFSLHPGTLQGAAKSWLAESSDKIKRLEEVCDDSEGYGVSYRWVSVENEAQLRAAPLVAIHPDLASYNAQEGLVLGQAGEFTAEVMLRFRAGSGKAEVAKPLTRYSLEPYTEHVQRVYDAFEASVWQELAPAAAVLERRAGWPSGSVKRAATLAVLLHDVGKLTVRHGQGAGWQIWVQKWQERIGSPIPKGYVAAHTDYDSDNEVHRLLMQSMPPRPSHAVEGAVSVAPLLAQALREQVPLLKAAFSAIARHHGSFVKSFGSFTLVSGANQRVNRTLKLAGTAVENLDANQMFASGCPSEMLIDDLLVDVTDNVELLAYMLLARALRLADQAGTAAGTTAERSDYETKRVLH